MKKIFSFKKKKILRHVLECPSCNQKLKTMAELHRSGEKIVTAALPLLQKTEKKRMRFSLLSFFSRPARIVVTFSIIILFGSLGYVLFFKSDKMVLRSVGPTDSVFLHADKVKRSDDDSLLFNWKMLDSADHYVLEIFKEDLTLLWRSEHINTNTFKLPAQVYLRLERKKKYYWSITAYIKNGSSVESELMVIK